MKQCKKFLSLALSCAVALQSIGAAAAVTESDFSDVFSFSKFEAKCTSGSMQNTVETVTDGGIKVLKWSTDECGTNSVSSLKYSLDKPITVSDAPIEIITECKIADGGNMLLSFPALSPVDTFNTSNDTWFGIMQHSNGLADKIGIAAGCNRAYFAHNKIARTISIPSGVYVSYRFLIDTKLGGFRFYMKPENERVWTQPYANTVVDMTAEKEGREPLPAGVFPLSSTLDQNGNYCKPAMVDTIASLKYEVKEVASKSVPSGKTEIYFKNISVRQPPLGNDDIMSIYVSPSGNDDNDGSIKSPLATLGGALELFRLYKKVYGVCPTIYFRGGEYRLDSSVTLDDECSGVSFSAYGDEKVYISAGYSGGSITPATADDIGGRLPKNAIGRILKWDVSGYGNLTEYFDADFSRYSPELVEGCTLMTNARFPNSGWSYTGKAISSAGETEYEFEPGAPVPLTVGARAKAAGFWAWNYRYSRARITNLGDSLKAEVMKVAESEKYFNSNRRYYLYDAPEFLDVPGEYYIDYENKQVYYYPINPGAELQLTGLSDGMFILSDGVTDVSFVGLGLINSCGTAVSGNKNSNITVDSCTFNNIGGRGVRLTNAADVRITKSYFGNIGDSSVELTGGDQTTLKSANCTVDNCEFENGARITGTYAPFVQLGETNAISVGMTAENNYFHNHMHSALIFEGNDMIIINNIFDNIVNATQDAGAIYSRVNPTYRGNEITRNLFRNISSYMANENDAAVHAVYLDDLLQDVKVTGNVFYKCTSAINIAGGHGNEFSDNLVYDCFEGGAYALRGNNRIAVTEGAENSYLYNMTAVMRRRSAYDEDLWFAKYPKYKNFVENLYTYNSEANKGVDSQGNVTYADEKAAYITDAVFSGNTFVCRNAYGNAIGAGSTFFNIFPYDEAKGYGVNDCDNLVSTDMSSVTVDGISISVNGIDAQRIPDMSQTGIIEQSEICPLDSGRNGNGINVREYVNLFDGYRYESFDGYADGADVTALRSFDVTGDGGAALGADDSHGGYLSLLPSASAHIATGYPVRGDFALGIWLSGKLNLSFGDEADISFESDGLYEAEYVDSEKLLQIWRYDFDSGEWDVIRTVNRDLGDGFSVMNITAQSSARVYALSLAKLNVVTSGDGYVNMDFERFPENAAAEYCADGIYSSSPYGGYSLINETENGNRALHFYTTADARERSNKFEIRFNPINMNNNKLCVEFDLRNDGRSGDGAYFRYVMMPVGYIDGRTDGVRVLNILSENDRALVMSNSGKTVATADELSEYVSVKYVLDKTARTADVYRRTDGTWTLIDTLNSVNIPDYINRLQTNIMSYSDDEIGCYFDNIKVYSDGKADFAECMAKKEVFETTPDYIAGMRQSKFVAALYDKNGNMLDVTLKTFRPKTGFSADFDRYNSSSFTAKRFVLKDLQILKPLCEPFVYR